MRVLLCSLVIVIGFAPAGLAANWQIAGARCETGSHGATWKGRDDAGRELPSGIYFTRFEAAGERQSGKLTLIR